MNIVPEYDAGRLLDNVCVPAKVKRWKEKITMYVNEIKVEHIF